MTNVIALDVAIGLIFIYLIYGLLATIILELLASKYGLRSKILERAIFRMLEEGNMFNRRFKSIKDLFNKPNDAEKGRNVLKIGRAHV